MTDDNRYSNAKMYTIRYKNDDSMIYVGSTIHPLYKRWHEHKRRCFYEPGQHYNHLLYRRIRETNDINDWYIELYEDFACMRKEQLLQWKDN